MFLRRLALCFLVLGLLVPLTSAMTASSWPASTTPTDLTTAFSGLTYHLEPSGVMWHETEELLYVVGNEGHLAAVDLSGTLLGNWSMSGDIEGITYDPANPTILYVIDENTGSIKSWSTTTHTFVQTWSLYDASGVALSERGGWAGVEGLEYADGYFYVGYQYDGVIYKYDLSGSTAVLKDTIGPFSGYTGDISALSYYEGYMYVLFDSYDDLLVTTLDGDVVYQYTDVPGIEQEGFALLPSTGTTTTAVIADDNGDLKLYEDFPVLTPDADGDGVAARADCNDSDATVSAVQTYYTDADADTLGSDTAVSLCVSSAPSGYSANSNDTNDLIPNYGVEIKADGVDNNGNGSIDETNVGFLHPYYSTLDPAGSYSANVKKFWGLKNGYFAVSYKDKSVFKYRAFTLKSSTVPTLASVSGTAYVTVHLDDSVALVNAYTGVTVSSTTLSSPTETDVLNWALTVLE